MARAGAVRPRFTTVRQRPQAAPAVDAIPPELSTGDVHEGDEPIESEFVGTDETPPRSPFIRDLPTEHLIGKPVASPHRVRLEPSTVEDIDTLWDWIRGDAEGAQAFFGVTFRNSRELYEHIHRIAGEQERSGVAWWRSIGTDRLIGFVMLKPITRAEGQPPTGLVHLYIEPSHRGELSTLLPSLLQTFDETMKGYSLMVITDREAWAQMVEPHGFTRSVVLTRHAGASTGVRHG